MYRVCEQSQRDEVFQAVWLTIFQAEKNKPQGTKKKSSVNEDIAPSHSTIISIISILTIVLTVVLIVQLPTQTKNE